MTSYEKVGKEENTNNFKIENYNWFVNFYKSYFTKKSDWDTNTWFNMIYYNLYYGQNLFDSGYYLDKFACKLLEKFKNYEKYHSQEIYDIIGKKLYVKHIIKYIPKKYYNFDMFDVRRKKYIELECVIEQEANNIPLKFMTEDLFIHLYNKCNMDIKYHHKILSNDNVDFFIETLCRYTNNGRINKIHKIMIRKDLYNPKRIESMIKLNVNFIIDISNKYENKYDLSRMWLYCISENKKFIFKCPKEILENYSIPNVYQ